MVDLPVDLAAYWAATTADYGPHGLFLDRIVVNKVIDGAIWCFSSSDRPFRMEWFRDGQRVDVPVVGDVAAQVARRFGMDTAVVRAAFDALE